MAENNQSRWHQAAQKAARWLVQKTHLRGWVEGYSMAFTPEPIEPSPTNIMESHAVAFNKDRIALHQIIIQSGLIDLAPDVHGDYFFFRPPPRPKRVKTGDTLDK
jgi:hypothetical protein